MIANYFAEINIAMQFNTYHTVQRLCENRSRESGDTSAPSEQVQYDTKLVAMTTSLEVKK